MNASKYQVWEGETEAAALEENGVSLFTALFSAILGIALLFILLGKTVLMKIFGIKRTKRKISSMEASELKMSVS